MNFKRKVTRWEPNNSLPMGREEKGSKLMGLVGLIIVIGSQLLLLRVILNTERPIDTDSIRQSALMFTVAFPSIGLLMINRFFNKKETIISHNEVRYIDKSLLWKKEWSEPLSSYKGVLKENDISNGGGFFRKDGAHAPWKITLKHKTDSSRNIELYSHSRPTGVEPENSDETWKKFARLLNLPLLEKTAIGEKSIELKSRDIPPKNSVRKDSEKTDESEMRYKIGKSYKIQKKHDGYLVNIKTIKEYFNSFFLYAVLYYFNNLFYDENHKSLAMLILSLFFMVLTSIAAFLFIWKLLSKEELFFSNSKIKHQVRYPWGVKEKQILSTAKIKSIDIKKPENGFPFQINLPIIIENSGKPICFGNNMNKKDKIYIKNMIIKAISANSN